MVEFQNGRKPVTMSIKSDLISEYSKLCEEKGIVMSRRVEKFIEGDIKRVKEQK